MRAIGWLLAGICAAFGLAAAPALAQSADDVTDVSPPVSPPTPPAANSDDLLDDSDATGLRPAASDSPTAAALALRPSLASPLPRTVVRPKDPAQSAKLPVTGPIPAVIDREAEAGREYDALGLRLGSFVATATSTTTVGGTRSSVAGGGNSYVSHIDEVDLRSDWDAHSVGVKLRGGLKQIIDGERVTEPEADAVIDGRVDLSAVDRLSGSAGWTLRKDDDHTGKSVGTWSGTLGYERAAGLIGLKTSLGADRSDYQTGTDRDNTALSGALRLSLDNGAIVQPFIETGVFGRLYDRASDSDGLSRNGIGGEVKLGLASTGDRLHGEIAAGYAYEAIDAAGLADMRGALVEGQVVWTPTDLLTVNGTLSSSFEPTDTAGSPGSIVRAGEVTVTYALAPNAYVLGGVRLEDKDYVGIAQNEWTTTLRSGVGYRFNRNVEAGLALSHKIVDSSAAGADYNETTVEATLTLRR